MKIFTLLSFIFFSSCGSELDYLNQRLSSAGAGAGAGAGGFTTKALTFDGVDENVEVADHADFAFGGNMSAFIWVKASAGSLSASEVLLGHSNNSVNQRAWMIQVASDTNKFGVFISDNGGNGAANKKDYVSSVNVFDGQWHLIGFTFAAGTLRIYKDGVEDTTPTKVTDAAIVAIHDSTTKVGIGSRFNGGGDGASNFFSGSLDEAALWSTALSGAAVSALYDNGKAIDLSTHSANGSLISWWRLGDATNDNIGGTNIMEDVKSSHDGTVNNMESSDIIDR